MINVTRRLNNLPSHFRWSLGHAHYSSWLMTRALLMPLSFSSESQDQRYHLLGALPWTMIALCVPMDFRTHGLKLFLWKWHNPIDLLLESQYVQSQWSSWIHRYLSIPPKWSAGPHCFWGWMNRRLNTKGTTSTWDHIHQYEQVKHAVNRAICYKTYPTFHFDLELSTMWLEVDHAYHQSGCFPFEPANIFG